ncbi:aldehyde ferredoxin oxidoreductase C-terminal domain-containing protein [Haloarculaceae archaeon H-GB2-1]|nr:aldehyde ferredoxin oxidoreductase C-terminal domain-containing protein [Haloarculaceae archaeon H-GB1-1]MEA5385733.1 aldehyde ferredoxin oxidoreductase C-terminal domain-containing protein [Haloarculaceae archaeon H-GB11]MEA5407236.1 aldehyde ferredoxin oxidoreductase C-terminal domain-containing protein [Haloarculaceae archaeon H-GB2-1]
MTETSRSRILRVDLSAEHVESEPIPEAWRRQFLGGKGLGARYLYEEVSAGTDPLGPENALLFLLGPVSGYLPGETRYGVVTKSPLTGAFLDSYGGGTVPEKLSGALDDHVGLLVTGEADRPVTIRVEDDDATLEPATDLWGADAREVEAAFPDAGVACVGPPGEHAVKFATIASDGGEHHAGRGGAGAVMGAKRLKALVVHGEQPEGLADLREEYAGRLNRDALSQWFVTSETVETIDFANEVGVLATRGWQESEFEGADDIGIESVKEAATGREREDDPVPGGFRVETDDSESVPRGATAMTLGAGLGIGDFDAVAALGETCDRLGVDVISAGNAVAWAIRATEEGLVDRDIDFGDDEGARQLIEEMATRSTPLGDALADGVESAAERFGGENLVPTIKGMEMPSYDPREVVSQALAYGTSDRGACHRRSRPVETAVFEPDPDDPVDVARNVVTEQNIRATLWSLVADDFAGEALWETLGAEWLDAVGLSYTPAELHETGERIWNLTRLFNVREGFARVDDEVPEMLVQTGDGAGLLTRDAYDDLLSAYYAVRGWDEDGVPTATTLDRLGLLETVDEETPVGK